MNTSAPTTSTTPVAQGKEMSEREVERLMAKFQANEEALHRMNTVPTPVPTPPSRPTYVCCLCQGEFVGFGNNAQPVGNGRCCNMCNHDVIMFRLGLRTGDIVEVIDLTNEEVIDLTNE